MRQRWLSGLQLVVVALVVVSCGGAEKAKDGVSGFRARVANRSFAEIYRAASPEFRQSASEAQFERFMAALERRLGTWQSARDPVWTVTRGTNGHFVTLTYQSQFSKGPVTERFAWRLEHGAPVLVGYNVNSTLLVSE